MDHARAVSRLLRSEDPVHIAVGERALWSIWFRQAGPEAAEILHAAAHRAAEGQVVESTRLFNRLIAEHPDFAEAYHQRGMARYLWDHYYGAMSDLLRAVQLNPIHFAAMANLGHCSVQLGRYEAAQEWYLAALRVHPRLTGIRPMLRRLQDFMNPGTALPA